MLIIFLIQMVIAASTTKTVAEKEVVKSTIQKAQDLVLQQDKASAIQVLTKAIDKEKDKKNKETLLQNLNRIEEIFLTDKAQKIFEQGNFLSKTKPTEAITKFQEALLIEPTNLKILLNLGRAHLSLGQCLEANKISTETTKLNSFNEEAFLLYAQSQTCLHNLDGLEQTINSKELTRTDIQFQMLLVQAQIQFFNKQYNEALKNLQKASKMDSAFPEIYYWENQILEQMNKPATESAKQYVKTCKTISKLEQNKFLLEPRLCQEYKALEKKIASDESAMEKEKNE